MSWAFSLSVECGKSESAAEKFSQHFAGVIFTSSSGASSHCKSTLFQDIDESWWCRVCPTDISEMGIDTSDLAYIMTEMGILLYQHLQTATTYRYGIVGLEVDEFRTYSELLTETPSINFPGLVLAESMWKELASPNTFVPFTPGYLWQPYEGEVYRPLIVSTDLKEKMNRLLAA
ncbi:MAG: hypothetical protein AAFY33_16975 [Cyanobacteria bacterium J06643_4]